MKISSFFALFFLAAMIALPIIGAGDMDDVSASLDLGAFSEMIENESGLEGRDLQRAQCRSNCRRRQASRLRGCPNESQPKGGRKPNKCANLPRQRQYSCRRACSFARGRVIICQRNC